MAYDLIQPTDGFAYVQYRIIGKNDTILNFNPNSVIFLSLIFNTSIYQENRAVHTFKSLDPLFLDDLKQIMASAMPILEFRLGYGMPNSLFWLPWQRHIITKYNAEYESFADTAGHSFIIESKDIFALITHSNKTVARKGTIADIVQTIAEENNLESIIEPTEGKFMLYQVYTDDVHFIRERCLCRAINKQGQSGYYFFIKDNILHFHTPTYYGKIKQLDYYNNLIKYINITDFSQTPEIWNNGLAGVNIISYDPYTGQNREISNNPDKALKLADYIYQYKNIKLGSINKMYHLSYNSTSELEAQAQYFYQFSRMQTFKLDLTLYKTLTLGHGDFVYINIPQKNMASSHSGFYYVTETIFNVQKQALISKHLLERGEFLSRQKSLHISETDLNQLTPENKAPGYMPNLIEIQNSELTKGAGKQTTTKTFTILVDANTGKPLN